jgi:hypothetical protein
MLSYLRHHPEMQGDPGEPEVYIPTQEDWAEWSAWCDRVNAEQGDPLEQQVAEAWTAELAEMDAPEADQAGVLQ